MIVSPLILCLITHLSNFCLSTLMSWLSGFSGPSVLERNIYTRCIKLEPVTVPGRSGFLVLLNQQTILNRMIAAIFRKENWVVVTYSGKEDYV